MEDIQIFFWQTLQPYQGHLSSLFRTCFSGTVSSVAEILNFLIAFPEQLLQWQKFLIFQALCQQRKHSKKTIFCVAPNHLTSAHKQAQIFCTVSKSLMLLIHFPMIWVMQTTPFTLEELSHVLKNIRPPLLVLKAFLPNFCNSCRLSIFNRWSQFIIPLLIPLLSQPPGDLRLLFQFGSPVNTPPVDQHLQVDCLDLCVCQDLWKDDSPTSSHLDCVTHTIFHRSHFGLFLFRNYTSALCTHLDHVLRTQAESHFVAAVCLDIKAAYDFSVYLIYKLATIGIKGKMVRWIASFLNERIIQISTFGGNPLCLDWLLSSWGSPRGASSSPCWG